MIDVAGGIMLVIGFFIGLVILIKILPMLIEIISAFVVPAIIIFIIIMWASKDAKSFLFFVLFVVCAVVANHVFSNIKRYYD